MKDEKLRRVAILIASLDCQSADRLLDEMTPEEAARVRNAVMDLDEVDPREQQEIIEAFVRRTPALERGACDGVELDPSLAKKLGGAAPANAADVTAADEPRPFAFVESIGAAHLARVLAREHPQTAAIVLAHLPPARGADVLRQLPQPLQTEALCRIARLQPAHPEVLRDIEHELRAILAREDLDDPLASQGVAAVEAILRAGSLDDRQQWMVEVAHRDQTLARRLGAAPSPLASPPLPSRGPAPPHRGTGLTISPPSSTTPVPGTRNREQGGPLPPRHLEFNDLRHLEPAALALVLQAARPDTTLLALAGASPEFMQQILEQMPAREANQMQRRIQQLGPLRLDDVHRAQVRLAESAQRLIEQGRIAVPGTRRFAVAA